MGRETIPLSLVSAGEQVRLVRVRAGKWMVNRLTTMGLTPGVEFTVLQDCGGPKMLSVRGSKVAIGHGIAHRILVEVI
ncbi:MAG: ferrous iron transport protein A [Anaerolineales bacterium]|jgi:Fe2+ transport system protein FeoA